MIISSVLLLLLFANFFPAIVGDTAAMVAHEYQKKRKELQSDQEEKS